MKRFHVHVGVTDLAEAVRFYSALFGARPNVAKDDYAFRCGRANDQSPTTDSVPSIVVRMC